MYNRDEGFSKFWEVDDAVCWLTSVQYYFYFIRALLIVTKSFGVILTQELEVYAILKGGTQNVSTLQMCVCVCGGGGGGGQEQFYPVHIINDRSLVFSVSTAMFSYRQYSRLIRNQSRLAQLAIRKTQAGLSIAASGP